MSNDHGADDRQNDLYRAAMDAMDAHSAILDRSGKVLAVNAAWVKFAQDNLMPDPLCGVGSNYLDVCQRAAEGQAPDADAVIVAGAIAGLCAAENPRPFEHIYLCPHPTNKDLDKWFHLSLRPFSVGGEAHLLVAHTDISEKFGYVK